MISNTITLIRLTLTLPLALMLVLQGGSWLAMAIFLLCGSLDVLDGKVARARNETSRLGAMLDLAGDRLLLLSAIGGLLASGVLSPMAAISGLIILARCHIVASIGEALPNTSVLVGARLEPYKIAATFAGLAAAMAPATAPSLVSQAVTPLMVVAAALTLITLIGYLSQGIKEIISGAQ